MAEAAKPSSPPPSVEEPTSPEPVAAPRRESWADAEDSPERDFPEDPGTPDPAPERGGTEEKDGSAAAPPATGAPGHSPAARDLDSSKQNAARLPGGGQEPSVPRGGATEAPRGRDRGGVDGLDLSSVHVSGSDEEPGTDAVQVAPVEGTVDKPEVAIRPQRLNEEAEAPDTKIMTVLTEEQTPYTSAARFEDLNLSKALLMGLYTSMKFEKPSKVQAETLPMILSPPFRNLIAQAHNGSGKTTCFVLGMLSRVDPALPEPQAICVCPTRELAIQNEAVCLKMGCFTGVTVASTATPDDIVTAGSRRDRIVDQIVIGTPGTLKRWMTRDRILRTAAIRVLVFDEADHMLDQDGFQDDSVRMMRDIRKSTNNQCQVLLFSATFSERVKTFAHSQVRPANEVYVPRQELSLDVIKQYQVRCPSRAAKATVLKDRIFPVAERLGQSIIFVRTREMARELHMQLMAEGHRCTSIQGGMAHEDRDRVIQEFRHGTTKILISTDVLARGFDQAQVTLVVNYDIPVKSGRHAPEPEYETYLHRIGRSGRFGRRGAAFNLVCGPEDELLLAKIARHFHRDIPEVPWDDDDAFETVLKAAGLA